MTKDLFNIQDIFNRLDPTVMAEELAPGETCVSRVVHTLHQRLC